MTPHSLPPRAHTLISATRHIGYSLEAAVADLIDNSIAAGAKTINIFFDDVVAESYIAVSYTHLTLPTNVNV